MQRILLPQILTCHASLITDKFKVFGFLPSRVDNTIFLHIIQGHMLIAGPPWKFQSSGLFMGIHY